jgi:hypothetical protein
MVAAGCSSLSFMVRALSLCGLWKFHSREVSRAAIGNTSFYRSRVQAFRDLTASVQQRVIGGAANNDRPAPAEGVR